MQTLMEFLSSLGDLLSGIGTIGSVLIAWLALRKQDKEK